jgi:uncharacterized membrane protein YczE
VRLLKVVGSWLLIAVGIANAIRVSLGVAPFDVLTTGIAHQTGWSVGQAFVLVCVACYLLGWALGAPPGPASLVGTFMIGPCIDLALRVFPVVHGVGVRVGLFALGLVVIAAGISLSISSGLGSGPSEMIMIGLMARGLPVLSARAVVDVTPIVVGVTIGGALGAGTLVFALVMGWLVRAGLRLFGHPRLAEAQRSSNNGDMSKA